MDKWDKRFLDMTALIGTWSKDPSLGVGSVIVDENNRVVSMGFNGLASGVNDTTERLEDKTIKHQIVLHAENNAILFAKRDLTGCTIYTSPLPTCAHCASMIIQSGIVRVVTMNRVMKRRWINSAKLAREMFDEAGVEVVEYVDLGTPDGLTDPKQQAFQTK